MPPTPPEEIARQHQEALELIQQNLECPASNQQGEIPLSSKQRPICVFQGAAADCPRNEEKKDDSTEPADPPVVCVSSRGNVDVSALARLVQEGYDERAPIHHGTGTMSASKIPDRTKHIESVTNLWDETNAARNNVKITRASHDAWGIKKVVLLFCDDFLQDVYELPWWHGRTDIQAAVYPILDTLGVTSERVVRLLLAALPPGVTIPVHHDTGDWVRHTHRVHVPVIVTDPSRVLFRCGPTDSSMQRVDCSPGHVFEINNQGRHAVSNCGSDHRVHLILDYVNVDFDIRRRIQLEPGEQLLQTRRSIDRVVDRGIRKTPSYLILGAQKGGTTSLYEYIVQHPLVVRARRRETHCLDWRWDKGLDTVKKQRAHCHRFFFTRELSDHPSCLTGDSTPSYLLDSFRVIPRLKQVFNWPLKLFVMVRDPVKRANSHYAMVTSMDGNPQQILTRGTEWKDLSFEEVIRQDMERMQSCGLIPYWDIEGGVMDQARFADFAGSDEENAAWKNYLQELPLSTGSHSPVSRGMYELNLRPWFDAFPPSYFMVIKLEDMKGEGAVQKTLDKVWNHLELPPFDVEDASAKNTREYTPMEPTMSEYLYRFYEPHSRRLAKLLGMDWEDPWPAQTVS